MENKSIFVLGKEVTSCEDCSICHHIYDDNHGVKIICGYTGNSVFDVLDSNLISKDCPFSKPLTKEDIESCGFYKPECRYYENGVEVFKDNILHKDIPGTDDSFGNEKEIELEMLPSGNILITGDYGGDVLFNGKINNKLELLLILKQINERF